jgi:hypothetical protein
MSLAGCVFDQAGITRAKDMLGTIAKTNFQLTIQDDHELPARCRVPILKPPGWHSAEGDIGRSETLGPARGGR